MNERRSDFNVTVTEMDRNNPPAAQLRRFLLPNYSIPTQIALIMYRLEKKYLHPCKFFISKFFVTFKLFKLYEDFGLAPSKIRIKFNLVNRLENSPMWLN